MMKCHRHQSSGSISIVSINIITSKFTMSTPKYKVIYFNFQWIAEPIRYLLCYVKEDFEDVRLDWEEWERPDGKIDKSLYRYEKLPILEDTENGLILGQSFSIARYLGRKYNLVGATDAEAAKCDEYADVLKDISKEIELMVEADEEKKAELKTQIKTNLLEKTVPRYYSVIESDLKNNGGKYLVGNAITWIDFVCAHMSDRFSNCLEIDVLANYPTLKEHQQQIFQIPEIKAWIAKRPVTHY
ncbi:Glutathione S-transferase [Orchesella cincta]|uniref:glutathione transferase n=1 Tax=Orchesella cincta TaxID=48709 RepID=A0A1D2MB54_ORCCI|nr:Glutathione S-transferase [Orchesella cincta]